MLFARGASWIGVAGYFALFAGASFVLSALLNDPDLALRFSSRLFFFGASVFQFVAWALVALFLARKLGGGLAGTAWGTWLLVAFVYFIFGIALPGIAQGIVTASLLDSPQLVSSAVTALTFFWGIAMFPLLVWLAAAGHGRGEPGLRAIFVYLTAQGFGLWTLFIAVQLVSLLLNLGVNALLGEGEVTNGDLLVQQAVNSLRTVATVLFSIAAYREVREAGSPSTGTFA